MSIEMYPAAELVARAMRNLRAPPGKKMRRWVIVMSTFGMGSEYSRMLCRLHGQDPEEMLAGESMDEYL